MPIELICDHCGKTVFKSPSHVKKHVFCNHSCRAKYFAKNIEVRCIVCGKVQHRWPSAVTDTNLCSKECKRVWLNTKIEMCCDNCGKTIYIYQSKIRENNFCSTECGSEYRYKANESVCEYCGSSMQVYKHQVGIKKFCSKECAAAARAGKPTSSRTTETKHRISAGHQGIPYEEWDGYSDKTRRHVLPIYSCTQLNDRFDGSEGHHITRSIVVFIPYELHHHIPHNLKTGDNMGEMNMLALQFINGGYDG